MTDPHSLVQAFYARIWNEHDTAAVPELLSEDFTFRGSLEEERRGHGGFIEYVDFVHRALAQYRCAILDLLVEDQRAFARMLFSGLHRGEFFGYSPTHRRVQWHGAALFTISGGRIADLWVLGDVHGLLRQLARNAELPR